MTVTESTFVFVLIAGYDHESSNLVGVYLTKAAAEKEKARLEKRIQQRLKWADKWDGEGNYRDFGAYQFADDFTIARTKLRQ